MQHLQLILSVVLLSTGFGGITVAAIFWSRTRDRVLLLMLVVIGLFTLGLVVAVGLFYVESIVAYPMDLSGIVSVVNAVIVAAMYATLAVFVRSVRPEVPGARLALVAAPIALVYIVFVFVAPAVTSVAAWASANPEAVTIVSVTAASLYLGLCGWWIRRGSDGVENASVRFMVHALGLMLLGYSAASVVLTVSLAIAGSSLDPTVLLNYLLFLGWNVVAIVGFIRYLTHPVDLLESGQIPDDTRRRFGISAREAEVVVELSRGLSNKEIADRLGISFTTVRTHVYNIFRKTGAASRVELLRILSGR